MVGRGESSRDADQRDCSEGGSVTLGLEVVESLLRRAIPTFASPHVAKRGQCDAGAVQAHSTGTRVQSGLLARARSMRSQEASKESCRFTLLAAFVAKPCTVVDRVAQSSPWRIDFYRRWTMRDLTVRRGGQGQ